MILANLFSGIGADIVSALFGALLRGIADMFNWLIMGIVNTLDTTTEPGFANTAYSGQNHVGAATWFVQTYNAIIPVAIEFCVIVWLIGIISMAIKADMAGLIKSAIYGMIGIALLLSPIPRVAAQLCYDTVAQMTSQIFQDLVTRGAIKNLASRFAVATLINVGSGGAGLVLAVVIGMLVAVVVWFELIIREAMAYLAMALFPFAIAGLFWNQAHKWLRRGIELIVGIALSQIFIAVLIALAIMSFLAPGSSTGHGVGGVVQSGITGFDNIWIFLSFLFLATMGLPMALRLVPIGIEGITHAAEAAQAGRRTASGGTKAAGSKVLAKRQDTKNKHLGMGPSERMNQAQRHGPHGVAAVASAVRDETRAVHERVASADDHLMRSGANPRQRLEHANTHFGAEGKEIVQRRIDAGTKPAPAKTNPLRRQPPKQQQPPQQQQPPKRQPPP